MEHQKTSSCCSGNKTAIVYEYIDPVCGMQVAETSSYYFDYQDIRYLFCSASCQQKFSAQPDAYLKANQTDKTSSSCCAEEKPQKQSSCCGTSKEQPVVASVEKSSCCEPKPTEEKKSSCCGGEKKSQIAQPEGKNLVVVVAGIHIKLLMEIQRLILFVGCQLKPRLI